MRLQPTYAAASGYQISSVCQTRTDLLDRLASIVASLGLAKRELWSSVESGDRGQSESARVEVERLRHDCNSVRLELECHRVHHGC